MIRTYILTDRARKITETYLEEGVKLDGFARIMWEVKMMDMSRIEEDLELIKRLKEATR